MSEQSNSKQSSTANILVVEDDLEISENLNLFLKASNFNTHHLDSGEHVVKTVRENQPDIILLDIMLPVVDGLECCRQIREFSDIPIIMMTAKVEEIDRLIGLEAGADDYVCKPFSAVELILRIKAILRRTQKPKAIRKLELNLETFILSYQQSTVELTNLEFGLFKLLYQHPERIYSRAQILDLAYPDMRDISDRAIDSHIKNIRKKAIELGLEKSPIESVYGAGYRYIDPD
ncbi:response regulator [Aliikangiella coralliicola]|uniref:Response regulator n=1 Tax=Aliikangiella coralliicola TaxID=2592383 RepID=A0A545UJ23_9GAMM|nr:response regulator [Aliikangiella coralliicola]TQV89474.1 response regulator [Aliikangiella coralliicola]